LEEGAHALSHIGSRCTGHRTAALPEACCAEHDKVSGTGPWPPAAVPIKKETYDAAEFVGRAHEVTMPERIAVALLIWVPENRDRTKRPGQEINSLSAPLRIFLRMWRVSTRRSTQVFVTRSTQGETSLPMQCI